MNYARKTKPTKTSKQEDFHAFRVWAHSPTYQEDPKPWKCYAMFRYLEDCLDFIAGQQDAGCDVVFQSPAHTKTIRSTDRRVVYRPEMADSA